ncbi:MAG: AAA family ATPase [Desulfurococcales archaeon]|nr:AAA family ATPase [Desulfurococcales archaeon]
MSTPSYTLYLKNYKALYTPGDPLKIDIGDITLIIGPRSSGKSSILEALWLLPVLGSDLLQSEDTIMLNLAEKNRALFTGSKKIRLFNLVNQQSLIKNNEVDTLILLVENNKLQYYGVNIYYKFSILNSHAEINKINNEKLDKLELESEHYKQFNIDDTENSAVKIHALSVHRIFPRSWDIMTTADDIKTENNDTILYTSLVKKLVSAGIGLYAENIGMIIRSNEDAAQPFYDLFNHIVDKFIELFNKVNEKENLPKIEKIVPRGKTFSIIYDDNTRIPFENLSMGTKNLLSILMEIAVVHVLKEDFKEHVKGDFIVEIEEPELALHASTLTALTNIMEEETKYMRFLLTSHSPRLLLITSAYKDIDSRSYMLLKEEESYLIEIGEELGENERAALYPMLSNDINILYNFYAKILEKYDQVKK